MQKIYKNKKGDYFIDVVPQFFSYITLILVLLIFFVLFGIKGCGDKSAEQKIQGEISNLDANIILLNYLRTSIEIENSTMTIADIVSMVDIEEGKEKRIKAFQETAKSVFEKQFPPKHPKWNGAYPWWIRVYDKNDKPSKETKGAKYFRVLPLPGKGYIYGPGAHCNRLNKEEIVKTQTIPKINGGSVDVVFCISKLYLEKTK